MNIPLVIAIAMVIILIITREIKKHGNTFYVGSEKSLAILIVFKSFPGVTLVAEETLVVSVAEDLVCIGFSWRGAGSRETSGVVFVRKEQDLPECWTEQAPAGSKTAPELPKEETVSNTTRVVGTSVTAGHAY